MKPTSEREALRAARDKARVAVVELAREARELEQIRKHALARYATLARQVAEVAAGAGE